MNLSMYCVKSESFFKSLVQNEGFDEDSVFLYLA